MSDNNTKKSGKETAEMKPVEGVADPLNEKASAADSQNGGERSAAPSPSTEALTPELRAKIAKAEKLEKTYRGALAALPLFPSPY